MRILFGLFTIGSMLSGPLRAQLIESSQLYALGTDHTSGYLGAGMSVADFTGDGWDDATFVHHGGSLFFYSK